ncbi:MAG: transglycosylase SLT domain-containing protein, partial [Bryocella sp.]
MWMAAGLTVVAGLVVVPCARAFERVTYTSGLEDTFAHHRVVGSVIRFYKSADETSWQDVPEARVAAITVEADPVIVASKKVSVVVAPQIANEARPTLGEMKAMLAEAGDIHDVDPALLASVVKIESGFRVDARSKAGARGLMQLMPGTAKQMGVGDPLRAQDNIRGGTAYLDELLRMYH